MKLRLPLLAALLASMSLAHASNTSLKTPEAQAQINAYWTQFLQANPITPAGIGAVPATQYMHDQATLYSAISAIQGVTVSNTGVFTATSPNGTVWTSTLSVAATSSTLLTAPGPVAGCLNGSCFSWANQTIGATVTGGDSGGTTAELNINAQSHTAPANQTAIVANMPSGQWCIALGMYITDPTNYYNSGLFLRNPTTGQNTTVYNVGSSPYGTYLGVQVETDFSDGNAKILSAQPGYDNGYPIGQTSIQMVCDDGINLIFYKTPSGAPGTLVQLAQTTIANAGSPTQIGFFEDAFSDGNPGDNYLGVAHFTFFRVFPGSTPPAPVPGGDLTETFLTTPNYPTSDTLPAIAGLQPDDGVTLPANSANGFAAIFGTQTPGANFTTMQQVLNGFYTNYDEGNLNAAIGSPNDTGQPNTLTFASVARTYPLGDVNAVHTMLADGIMLSNNCSRNHTYCYPGQIWGALLDTPGGNPILPNSLTQVRYRSGAGQHHWDPIWLFSNQRLLFGSQTSSGYGRFTFSVQCTGSAPPNGTGGCYEIDMNDFFARLIDGGTPVGAEVIFWTPNYGYSYTTAAHWTYMANTPTFSAIYKNEQYEQLNTFNCALTFCDIFLNWRGPPTNLLDLLIAPVTSPPTPAKLISQVYMEYNPVNDGPNGAPLGLNLMVSAAQAIPGSSLNGNVLPDYAHIVENDGLPNGWSLEIQKIASWPNASIPNPDSYKPTM